MRRLTVALFVVILLTAVVRVGTTYRLFSGTNDEPVHVAAGLEWLTAGTYKVDREHPPLARVLFALGPYLGGAELAAKEDRIELGNDVLYRGGAYRRNLAMVRAGNLPFFLLSLVVVALWTRRLFGDAPAIVAAAFMASLPPILAHAGLATTDMSVAALTITSLFALALWLEKPSWPRAMFLGAAIGLGLISKMSFLVFFPAGAILLFVRRDMMRLPLRQAIAVPAAAFLIVWAGYRFDAGTINEVRLSTLPEFAPEYHAARYARTPGYEWVRADILKRYWAYSNSVGVELIDFVDWAKAAGYPSPLAGRSGRDTMAGLPRVLPPGHYDRFMEPFRKTWQWIVVRVPIPAPEFITGVKYVQVHSSHGHPAYLFGEQHEKGWWYYFPVVFLFKTPIPFLFFCAAGTLFLLKKGGAEIRCVALAPWLMLGVAMTSNINIGVRHVLPMYPLLTISAAYAAVTLWQRSRIHRIGVAILLLWHFTSTTLAHPDYLAWFNGAAGPRPDRIALDSNLDWGQDLLRLDDLARRDNLQPLWVAYFGSARRDAMSVRAKDLPAGECRTGWLAVSEMRYHTDGSLRWLERFEPVRRVGKSIRLYKIDTCPKSEHSLPSAPIVSSSH